MTDDPNRSEQRKEEVLKAAVMVMLDLWPPDQRPVVLERVTAQLREKFAKRDTQRVHVIPREDPL